MAELAATTTAALPHEVAAFVTEAARARKWSAVPPFVSVSPPTSVTVLAEMFRLDDMSAEPTAHDLDALFGVLTDSARKFGLVWNLSAAGSPFGRVDAAGHNAEARAGRDEVACLVAAGDAVVRAPWPAVPPPRRPTTGVNALRTRWPPQVAGSALHELFTEGRVSHPPFPSTSEGRLDLRGVDLHLAPRATYDGTLDCRLDIVDVDLSWSMFSVPAFSTLPRCRYIGCALDGVTFPTGLVGRFDRCTLRWMAAYDFWGAFSDCDLTACRITKSFVLGGPVVRSTFDRASFKRVHLLNSRDEHPWEDCSFRGTDFTRADLVRAVFRRCAFTEACFFDTFYGMTRFESCAGLDVERMFAARLLMMGSQLGERGDILVS